MFFGSQGVQVQETGPLERPPRSRPQQRRSRDKLDRILAASAKLLEEIPYDELGTKLIAEHAGVSVGGLYRFFPDKESIAEALLVGWLDKMVEILKKASAAELPEQPCAFIGQTIDAYAEFFRRHPGFREVFCHAQYSPELKQAKRRKDEALATLLHDVLTVRYQLSGPGLGTSCGIAVRVGYYLLDLGFRENPDGDLEIIEEAKKLLCRYLGA